MIAVELGVIPIIESHAKTLELPLLAKPVAFFSFLFVLAEG